MSRTPFNRFLNDRRIDMIESRLPGNLREAQDLAEVNRAKLLKGLGMHPQPPRTDLKTVVTGSADFDGYAINKIRFESKPGYIVTGLQYVPKEADSAPYVLIACDESVHNKNAPWIQAFGIGLALYGIGALFLDCPGQSSSATPTERGLYGDPTEPYNVLHSGAQSVMVWDLIRAIDFLESQNAQVTPRVAIVGFGPEVLMASALDSRIQAQCLVNAGFVDDLKKVNASKMAVYPIGDVSHLGAMRPGFPTRWIMNRESSGLTQAQQTHDKLVKLYRLAKAEPMLQIEVLDGSPTFNRRTRECLYGFLIPFFKHSQSKSFLPELRPLTDGESNPYPAGTLLSTADELVVTQAWERTTKGFADYTSEQLAEPYPEKFDALGRLQPWTRYGKWELDVKSSVLRISDPGKEASADTVVLPLSEIDPTSCWATGLSVAEFLAQLLHLSMPGGPEGWESRAVGADAITAVFSSVKSLVGGGNDQPLVSEVIADGMVASAVASYLKLLRPSLNVKTSHAYSSWRELFDQAGIASWTPQARYLQFPFTT